LQNLTILLHCTKNYPKFREEKNLKKLLFYLGTAGFVGSCTGAAGATGATAGAVLPDRTPGLTSFLLPNQVIPKVLMKNTAAKMAVVWDKKFAEPLAPNKLPEEPDPKAAPMSAPLPCCNKTKRMTARAETTCNTINKVLNHSTAHLQ
jgi:hypothetical protein